MAVVCNVLWGSAFPFIKLGYRLFAIDSADTASILCFAGVRFMMGAALVWLAGLALNRRPLPMPHGKTLASACGLGLWQTAAQYFFYYSAVSLLTGAMGGILNSTQSFMGVILAHFLYGKADRMTPRKALGCALGFGGVLIATLGNHGSGSAKGMAFMLIASAIFASAGPWNKAVTQHADSFSVCVLNLGVGGLALAVMGFAMGGGLHPESAAGIPVLLILVIQGSIWINYGIPTITNSPLFFLSYLVVSSIQMGANIDYAIVTTSRFMEFKDKMPKKDAIIETMNMSFPTIITSGLMMAIAGILIGQMTSNAAIAGIGDSLGRGTIITIFIVMFILPQILLLGEKVIDKTAFDMPSAVSSHQSSGRVRIDGMVRGEIHGQISGVVHAVVEGDVNISLLSGTAEPETPPEEPGTPEVPVAAEEEDAEHE